MSRTYQFNLTIHCGGPGEADLARVEELIDLSLQDLCYDSELELALDEKVSITINTCLV